MNATPKPAIPRHAAPHSLLTHVDIGTSLFLESLRETVDPGPGRFRELVLNLVVRATGPLQHVKTVIRSFEHMERKGLGEILANGLEQIEWSHLVPGPLQEEQWDADLPQMFAPFDTGFLYGVKGKGEDDDALHTRQRLLCRREGRHPATHRLAPRKKGEPIRHL
jgi:hypothetical protein